MPNDPNKTRRRVCSIRAMGLAPELVEVGILYAALTEAVALGGVVDARDALEGYANRSGVSDGGATARLGIETMRRQLADAIPAGEVFPGLTLRRLVDRVAVEGATLNRVARGCGRPSNGQLASILREALEEVLHAMADRAGAVLRLLV